MTFIMKELDLRIKKVTIKKGVSYREAALQTRAFIVTHKTELHKTNQNENVLSLADDRSEGSLLPPRQGLLLPPGQMRLLHHPRRPPRRPHDRKMSVKMLIS